MQPQHYTLTLLLSSSIAYLVIVTNYTFIHVCPLTQLIIIVLCICLLNHLRNKKKLQAKNTNTTRFHNYLCGYFDQRFCFLHLASSCHLVSLCFSLKDAPSRFQQGGLCAGLCPVTSVVSDSVTLWIVAPRLLCPGEFPGKKYWSGLPCPPPGDLPNTGIKHSSPVSSAFQVNSLLLSHQGSPGQVYRAVTMINSPSFCLSGSIFTSSFLEGTFTRYVNCGSQIFFFQQFTYHATASVVADEKLGISLIEKSLVPKSSLLSCCCLEFVFGS